MKIQSGRTLHQTLRKWELRAPDCPFLYHKYVKNITQDAEYSSSIK
jgi:hypothetical protein